MLKSLTVTNFALIDQAQVEFAPGLNILTGETGAGKSILIDALNTLLGSRTSTDLIRSGCEYFRVEAVFEIGAAGSVAALLEEQGIPVEEGQLIISRRYTRSGKNTIIVNGCQVPLSVLRELGGKLVDMHGQHENQTMLRPDSYLTLVDGSDPRIEAKLGEYSQIYQEWTGVRDELLKAEKLARERMQRLDMLNWQTEEIAAACLKPGEDEALDQEIRVLANAEKIATALSRAYTLLQQGPKGGGGVLPLLADAKRELETAARFDPRIQKQADIITEAFYQLEEAAGDIRRHSETIDFEPRRLDQLQERQDLIQKLKKKYGATINEVLAYYQQALSELAVLTHFDEHMAELSARKQRLEERARQAADELDALRQRAAKQLAAEVSRHLQDLGMPKARFVVQITKTAQLAPRGCNEAMLLFSANPGEEPKPLHKVASGGELSRIALAVKTVCASRDETGVMVFDEVDAGIGGQTAQMVAEKIALVAADKQVLCITHLPQLACMADHHILIRKEVEQERTTTRVQALDETERVLELTRMVAGDNLTDLAIENAREMVALAKRKKEKWKNKAQA